MLAVMEVVPAEALAGVLLGALVAVADRSLRLRIPVWALVAVAVLAPYGLRREPWLLALCLGLALPLSAVLFALARRHGVTVMLCVAAWSAAAAALATPDVEGPLLLAGFLGVVAVTTVGRTPEPTTLVALLVAAAWALAIAHGVGGRPTALVGALAAWAVPVGVVIGGRVPLPVLTGLHLVIAPWLARITGLREAWLEPLIVVGVAAGATALAVAAVSALVHRLGRHADHGAAGGDVARDHGAGADHDVVADPAAG